MFKTHCQSWQFTLLWHKIINYSEKQTLECICVIKTINGDRNHLWEKLMSGVLFVVRLVLVPSKIKWWRKNLLSYCCYPPESDWEEWDFSASLRASPIFHIYIMSMVCLCGICSCLCFVVILALANCCFFMKGLNDNQGAAFSALLCWVHLLFIHLLLGALQAIILTVGVSSRTFSSMFLLEIDHYTQLNN